jgi:hypothetical protein
LRKNSLLVALSLCSVLLLAPAAPAQRSKKSGKRTVVAKRAVTSGAETGLVGIKLFDSGTRVVSVYGSPDAIEAVTLGGGGAGPGAGPGGGKGGAPGLSSGGLGGGSGAAGPPVGFDAPGSLGSFDFGNSVLDFQKGGGMVAGPPNDGGGGGGGTGGGGGGGMVGGVGGNSDRIIFTRWVYNRNASKYGFILDKFNHVVQIEAIGMESGKARTRRGLGFGSSWASMIKKYGAPDGYEIAGDNIVARYLSKNKVAFRFSRLGENKPHVVTGIVVAAGKR